jgi:hypothetical protein
MEPFRKLLHRFFFTVCKDDFEQLLLFHTWRININKFEAFKSMPFDSGAYNLAKTFPELQYFSLFFT